MILSKTAKKLEKYIVLVNIIVNQLKCIIIYDDSLSVAYGLISKKDDPILQLIRYVLNDKEIFGISFKDFYKTTHIDCESK